MSKRLSNVLFDQDREALKDYNKTNHVHRAHKANPDPVVVVKWFLFAFLFLAGLNLTPGYREAQARNREAVKKIFIPTSEVNAPR